MRQEVYSDERPLADYDQSGALRVFVHLCSAEQWNAITGELPPPTPVDREAYMDAGLPWFDYYDADEADVLASEILSKVKSVGKLLGYKEDPYVPVDPSKVVKLGAGGGDVVADGTW